MQKQARFLRELERDFLVLQIHFHHHPPQRRQALRRIFLEGVFPSRNFGDLQDSFQCQGVFLRKEQALLLDQVYDVICLARLQVDVYLAVQHRGYLRQFEFEFGVEILPKVLWSSLLDVFLKHRYQSEMLLKQRFEGLFIDPLFTANHSFQFLQFPQLFHLESTPLLLPNLLAFALNSL